MYFLLTAISALLAAGPTVNLHSAVNVPTLTVIVASPSPLAVTVPFSLTTATLSFDEFHSGVISSVVSSGLIINLNVSEDLLFISYVAGMLIDLTCIGSVTITLHSALFPFGNVAVIVVSPTPLPDTRPVWSTVAAFVLLLAHVTVSVETAES